MTPAARSSIERGLAFALPRACAATCMSGSLRAVGAAVVAGAAGLAAAAAPAAEGPAWRGSCGGGCSSRGGGAAAAVVVVVVGESTSASSGVPACVAACVRAPPVAAGAAPAADATSCSRSSTSLGLCCVDSPRSTCVLSASASCEEAGTSCTSFPERRAACLAARGPRQQRRWG